MHTKTNYRHLRQADRDRIEALLDAGEKQCEIAKILKVDPGTISREKKKRQRKDGLYDASLAHQKAVLLRRNSKYQGMKIEEHPELEAHIVRELKKKRSPDEIAGRMKRDKLPFYASKNAIYKWLYSVWGQAYCSYLCTKRYRKRKHKKKTPRTMIPNRIGIEKRPLGATNKTRYRHFEGDTAVAPRRVENTAAIAVAVERKSKLMLGTKIPSLAPREMTLAVEKMEHEVDMASLTLDNGMENRDHEVWDVSAFFADPHSPWQKPYVENGLGLLRRWKYKKGTDWQKVSEEELQEEILFLNNKYRKSLGYQSALEVASAHGMIIKKEPRKDCT